MLYRNVKTGQVIETSSELTGGAWVPCSAQAEKPASAPKKNSRKGKAKK